MGKEGNQFNETPTQLINIMGVMESAGRYYIYCLESNTYQVTLENSMENGFYSVVACLFLM